MKFIYLFIYSFIFSCGYPDIDSVPNFKNLEITKEESIDLCKLSSTDNKEVIECLYNLNVQNK